MPDVQSPITTSASTRCSHRHYSRAVALDQTSASPTRQLRAAAGREATLARMEMTMTFTLKGDHPVFTVEERVREVWPIPIKFGTFIRDYKR